MFFNEPRVKRAWNYREQRCFFFSVFFLFHFSLFCVHIYWYSISSLCTHTQWANGRVRMPSAKTMQLPWIINSPTASRKYFSNSCARGFVSRAHFFLIFFFFSSFAFFFTLSVYLLYCSYQLIQSTWKPAAQPLSGLFTHISPINSQFNAITLYRHYYYYYYY